MLLFTQDFPPAVGGIETYSWELARCWSRAQGEVVVLCPQREGSAAIDRAAPFEVVRTRIPCDTFALSGWAAALPIVRRRRIDAVFLAQWQTGPSLLRARAAGRVRRLFVAAHGRELLFAPFAAAPPVQAACDRMRLRVLREADALFPVSRYTAGLITRIGVDRERVFVVGNGTDPARFSPGDGAAFRRRHDLGERPVIATIGRLVARKGVDDVLRAIPRLRARHPALLYVIAGGGPDRSRLEALAAELGVAGSVRFLGRVADDEVPELYRACDVFVTASRDDEPDVEGFGIVFLEAAASERAAVGTRAGGIADAIVDGETGLLVPQGDPEALAGALDRLLGDAALRGRLGAAGRRRVLAGATWEASAARILEHMRSLE